MKSLFTLIIVKSTFKMLYNLELISYSGYSNSDSSSNNNGFDMVIVY